VILGWGGRTTPRRIPMLILPEGRVASHGAVLFYYSPEPVDDRVFSEAELASYPTGWYLKCLNLNS
jgi:hypothetical protein